MVTRAALPTSPLGIIGVYLLVVSPPLFLGPWSGAHLLLTAAHLGLTIVALRAYRVERHGWPVSWLVIASLVLMYGEIPWLNQAFASGYRDPAIIAVESALFGSPATAWAGGMPHLLFSEVLHLAYVGFYPAIVVPPLLLMLRGRRDAFTASAWAMIAAATACYVVFVYFPVQGPRYIGPPEGVPDGPVRRLALRILEGGSSRGAAFPSSHMSITTAQAVVLWQLFRPAGVVVAITAVGVALGAVYGGFHYATDMVIGGVIGLGAGRLALSVVTQDSATAEPT